MEQNLHPLLSIVIPVYNEEKNIDKCLSSLNEQSYKKFEIIIVDDGSTDKTLEIVRKFKNVKILQQNHKGPGAARNLGAEKARGEILILIDADMTFDKDYLKFLIAPIIEKNSVGTEEEIQYATNLGNIWSRCWGKLLTNPNKGERKIFRAIRKNKFLELGGFDPQYGYADDQTFYLKHKIPADVAKNAVCYHKNPETLRGVYKQSRWIGASLNNLLFRMPIVKYFSPVLLVLASPVAIPLFAVKRCAKNKEFKILVPWMLIFSAVKYFGTVHGIFWKIYRGKNVR